jgi:hypothetical protein
MTRNGMLVCKGVNPAKNIGDYIQSLCAELFFESIDCLLERERLDSYNSIGERTKVIMNGWFMHNPRNWPPGEAIDPLLISFHITPDVVTKMLTPDGIAYLRKHGPVGCRDTGTERILNEFNIPCYFSGCLTLALGDKFSRANRSQSVMFVDPNFEHFFLRDGRFSLLPCLRRLLIILANLKIIYRIGLKFDQEWYRKFINAASFYSVYSRRFSDAVLLDAEYVSHSVKRSSYPTETAMLEHAREFLKKYAESRLVITSRLHCALPCLGMGTPVIFITSESLESDHPIRKGGMGRFGGLLELLRVMRYEWNGLTTKDPELSTIRGKITSATNVSNRQDYLGMKHELIRQCRAFADKI